MTPPLSRSATSNRSFTVVVLEKHTSCAVPTLGSAGNHCLMETMMSPSFTTSGTCSGWMATQRPSARFDGFATAATVRVSTYTYMSISSPQHDQSCENEYNAMTKHLVGITLW
jgi:hypothetical protein